MPDRLRQGLPSHEDRQGAVLELPKGTRRLLRGVGGLPKRLLAYAALVDGGHRRADRRVGAPSFIQSLIRCFTQIFPKRCPPLSSPDNPWHSGRETGATAGVRSLAPWQR